ncbi:MAG: trypsin-like peptidase domain-containing protein [Rhodocyclaceae bacterium]
MAAAPHIVSFWRDKERQHFLCSGLLLDGRHVLTVAHAFENLSEGGAAFVSLVPGRDGAVSVSLMQRHQTLDAAIFKLNEEVAGLAPIIFCERNEDLAGRAICLHVVDPDTHNYAKPANYAVSNYDSEHREYVVTPESAQGYSGGVVECGGRIVGLLNRRVQGEPLARAISIEALRPWIAWVVDTPPELRGGGEQTFEAFRALVGGEILSRLANDGTSLLREQGRFAGEPTALTPLARSARFQKLIVSLHDATSACLDQWKTHSERRRQAIKDDCFVILGELIKLAVDKQLAQGDRVRVCAASPDRMFVACRKVGTAVAVYCALRDVPLVVTRAADGTDLAGRSIVNLGSLAQGVGADAERDTYRAVWLAVKGSPVPAQLDAQDFVDILRDAIEMERELFGNPSPLIVAEAPPEWLENGGLATAAGQLKIGLVLREADDCPLLVVTEARLINLICKYLTLLETL